MILKEWDANKAIKEISFNLSTFTAQIHGLPPVFLHDDTALKIGERMGGVHRGTINKRSVMHNSYLRFRIDIDVRKSLPVSFFQERKDGYELWIQFKFERLPDFCFKCGMIDHVTGKCHFKEPTYITTINGVSAQLFGV